MKAFVFPFLYLVLTICGDVENPLNAPIASSPAPIIIPQSRMEIFNEDVHTDARQAVYILTDIGFIDRVDEEVDEIQQFNALVFEDRTFAIMFLVLCLLILVVGLVVKFGID